MRERQGAGFCPACERYVGRVPVCGYCDSETSDWAAVVRYRRAACLAALGGFVTLYLRERLHGALPPAARAELLPTLFHAHVHWMLWSGLAFAMTTAIPVCPPPAPAPGHGGVWRAIGGVVARTAMFVFASLAGFLVYYALPQADPASLAAAAVVLTGTAALARALDLNLVCLAGAILFPAACHAGGLAPQVALWMGLL